MSVRVKGLDGAYPLPVLLSDQTTPPLQLYFAQSNSTVTTLSTAAILYGTSVVVVNAAIFSAGDKIVIISSLGRFFSATVLSVVSTTINFDTPLDFAFSPLTSEVISQDIEMNVVGSLGSPEVFKIRGGTGSIDVPITIDITRLIGYMITDGAPDLSKFGDLTALTNGLVLRESNGIISNIHNVKTNGDIVNLCFDQNVYLAANPGQGLNGLGWRMTFAGQSKHGVALRLGPDQSLDYIVQDDLSDLVTFRIVAEGHITDD